MVAQLKVCLEALLYRCRRAADNHDYCREQEYKIAAQDLQEVIDRLEALK